MVDAKYEDGDRYRIGPLIISSESELLPEGGVAGTDVKQIVLDHIFNSTSRG